MALSPGDKLGPYEILAPIGAGGMGEVYRAHDSRLNRDVAIKVSAAQFSERFEREAKAIAALNHPNICTLYDVGPDYLVMEYIEGETPKGPMPLDEALRIARQVADALEAAHDKDITHRDLKPGNIKIKPDGTVKVLDFGLAKVGRAAGATSENSPTLTIGMTEAGMILGTAAYMAPEQARGKENVDKRADIWAFGVVLYELLTGKRLFQGEDVGEILASVIKEQPSLDDVPRQVRPLLKRCLEKDPKKRLRDIGDVWALLVEEAEPATPAPPTQPPPAPWHKSWLPWCIAAFVLLALMPANILHFRETPPPDPVLHLSVPLPGNAPAGFAALSPDGRRLVISRTVEGKSQLWLRSLDSPRLQLLPGTENARGPFWSPDGRSIGFFADGKLKTIPAAGGPPQVLCDGTGTFGGGTWNRAGVILFSTSGIGDPLRRVNASGSACTAVSKPEGGSRHGYPEFLPDGKHFVYVVHEGDEAKRGIYIAALDNPTSRRLLADESSAVFAPSTTGKKYGYLLFLRGNEIMAQPLSAETVQLAGDVFPVAAEASFSLNIPQIAASASAGGILVYQANLRGAGYQLTWLDRSGKELGKVGSIEEERHVALSPDGKMTATVRAGNQGIWLYDVQRGRETRFTSPALSGVAPVWSPAGNLIAFGSGKGLYLKDASGGLKEELLLENGNVKAPSDWSRDGRYLIYTETDPKGQGDIWLLPDPLNKSSERRPVKFLGTDAVESQGQLSPDGRWLAYSSNESGQSEVYVRPFPSGPGRWKVSAGQDGSVQPRWRRDGKELYFLESGNARNRLMAVPVQSGPRGDFQAGAPQALFEFRALTVATTINSFLYGPSADGQRFLVNVQSGVAEPTLNVITKWEKVALASK
jgi:serine/threonine protein kinase